MTPEVYELPTSSLASMGSVTLMLALMVSAYSVFAGIFGQRHGRFRFVQSALYASWANTALLCLATAVIVQAFVSHDYTIRYVAEYSDTSMPLFYKLTAYWGGLKGSLLFWAWTLSLFSAVALYVNRHRHRDMIGYVVATIGLVTCFFLALLVFNKDPFATSLTPPPFDGKGLSPLLQNYWMTIHPPSLYLGFVSMTVPFAFCMGALASGRLDDAWLHSMRVWVIIGWFFLALGLTLGCIWAYEELGWGGYWAWDPVENAGLLPWFTATAFLHSIQIQERRGMFKTWNVVLMIVTFFLTIFGTFMTRSGVVQSVHAFGQDNELAVLFILFMLALLVLSFGLLIYRLPQLSSSARFESFASREFTFLLNNWILLGAAFFVLFATMFPTISESVIGQRITVGPPFFNKWMVPLGLVLLFLSGAGPLFAWRKSSLDRLFSQFLFPTVCLAVTLGTIGLFWPHWLVRTPFGSDYVLLPVAWACFGLVAFTFGCVFQEFYRGARARQVSTGGDAMTSLIGVFLSKRRKYGGYVVHLGIALMFFGWAGKARSVEESFTVETIGQVTKIQDLEFVYDEFDCFGDTACPPSAKPLPDGVPENHIEYIATFTVKKDGKKIAVMKPARFRYTKGGTVTTEVAIDRGIGRDIYLVLNSFEPQNKLASITVYLNPLVNWIWLGFAVLALGTLICLIPATAVGRFPQRKTRLGKLGDTALVLLVFGATMFAFVHAANAGQVGVPEQPSKHVVVPGAPAPTMDGAVDEPTRRVTGRLYRDMLCTCGDCTRRTVGSCDCSFAGQERKRLLARVKASNVVTEADEKRVYDEIIQEAVRQAGGQHVLTVPIDTGFNRLAWAVPVAALFGAFGMVFLVTKRYVRQGKAERLSRAGQPSPDADDDAFIALNDQLDDELDEVD